MKSWIKKSIIASGLVWVILCFPPCLVLLSSPDQPEGIGAIVALMASPFVFGFSFLVCYLIRINSKIVYLIAVAYLVFYFDLEIKALWGSQYGFWDVAAGFLYPIFMISPLVIVRSRLRPESSAIEVLDKGASC